MKKFLLTQRHLFVCCFALSIILLTSCETETFSEADKEGFAKLDTADKVNSLSLDEDGIDTTFVTNLMAGQHHIAGTLTVQSDDTNLLVTFKTNCSDSTGSWILKATHLYVGSCDSIPITRKGNPKIGKFPFKTEHNEGVNEFTYTIPLSDLDKCFCLAAHAEVDCGECDDETEEEEEIEGEGEGKSGRGDDGDNNDKPYCGEETAWAEGDDFPGNSWAMFLNFCKDTDTDGEDGEDGTDGEGEGEGEG